VAHGKVKCQHEVRNLEDINRYEGSNSRIGTVTKEKMVCSVFEDMQAGRVAGRVVLRLHGDCTSVPSAVLREESFDCTRKN